MHYLHGLAFCAGLALAQSDASSVEFSTAPRTTIATRTVASAISSAASMSTLTGPRASASTLTTYIYGLANTENVYGASVIAADQASTTYQVRCYTGDYLCIDAPFFMTQGSTSIHLSNSAAAGLVTLNEKLDCKTAGTTSASCSYSISAASGNAVVDRDITTAYTGSTIPHATFIITAGLDKLAAASTVTPSNTGNAASKPTIMSSTAYKGLLLTMIGSASAVLAFAVFL